MQTIVYTYLCHIAVNIVIVLTIVVNLVSAKKLIDTLVNSSGTTCHCAVEQPRLYEDATAVVAIASLMHCYRQPSSHSSGQLL